MKKKVFAVCDLESGYAYRLMDYIYEKEAGTFEVQAFTNVKNLSAFAREQEIELLLNCNFIRRRDSAGAFQLSLRV